VSYRKPEMDELDTFMFGVNMERTFTLEMLDEYLDDPRTVRAVIAEIMERTRVKIHS
jgi:hypothetical protein